MARLNTPPQNSEIVGQYTTKTFFLTKAVVLTPAQVIPSPTAMNWNAIWIIWEFCGNRSTSNTPWTLRGHGKLGKPKGVWEICRDSTWILGWFPPMSVESVEACEVVLCSNLPRSQVIHNTLVLLVLLVRAVPSTQPVLQDRTAALRGSSLRLRSAGGQAKKHQRIGSKENLQETTGFPMKYRVSMGFLWFVPYANPLNESAFHDQLHHQDWWDAENCAENCAENFTRLKTRRGLCLRRLGDSESLLWGTFVVEKSPPGCSGNRISMDFQLPNSLNAVVHGQQSAVQTPTIQKAGPNRLFGATWQSDIPDLHMFF